ncbi:MAG TPA: hypothetical protein VMJ10_19525 [Kofleriaceae bacterium]|nr:hypothetical protein [Kofleriaceae bacterium]
MLRGFEKPRRLDASAGTGAAIVDVITGMGSHGDFFAAKTSLADSRALE